MTLPFDAPSWMPAWLELLLLAVVALFVLAFLLMPFSVFGLKGRLDGVEARLDEIQGEIRSLALRLPEARAGGYEDAGPVVAPPIPPARGPVRAEPRLDWPR